MHRLICEFFLGCVFLFFVRLVCIDYWSEYVSTNIVSFIINVFTHFAYELLIYQFISTFCIGQFWLWPRKKWLSRKKNIYPCWQCWHRRWFGWKKYHFIEIEWDSLLKLSQKSYCMGKPPNEPLEMCIRKWLPIFWIFYLLSLWITFKSFAFSMSFIHVHERRSKNVLLSVFSPRTRDRQV